MRVHDPNATHWSQAPPICPCSSLHHDLCNPIITLNLTLTFAASWFGHAGHVG